VQASTWGGPGISNGVIKYEAWREAAVRVVCSHYDGNGPRNSELCDGDMPIECDGVDVRGFAPVPLQLVTRGPVGSIKQVRVMRDGQGVTARELLSDSTDLLLW